MKINCGCTATRRLQCQTEERIDVRITVLGKSPSWPDAAGACSGYLVQEEDFTLMLDCGNGVFSKLRRICDYVDVDAVIITHLHADHFLDLVPFSYALTYAPRQQPVAVGGWPGTDEPAHPGLFVPAGAARVFRRIVGCWGNEDLIDNAFDLHEYASPEHISAPRDLSVGPFHVSFCEVPHYVTTYAVELRTNGARFTFSADCKPNEQLIRFAADTEMLMIEATLPRPERTGIRGHLTPGEAGEHARLARAQRVVLTHYSDEMDPVWARNEAAASYRGPVQLAAEGAIYTL
jgi:ribonuclease BN (tRNA processing enzyme)